MQSGVRARLVGLLAIALALALAWFSALQPLAAARAHAPDVHYSIKAFILAPLLFVGGLYLIVGGAKVYEAFSGPPRGREQHLIVWSMFAIGVVAGGIAFWWVDAQFTALGYSPNAF